MCQLQHLTNMQQSLTYKCGMMQSLFVYLLCVGAWERGAAYFGIELLI